MSKVVALSFNDFMKGRIVPKRGSRVLFRLRSSSGAYASLVTVAGSATGWMNILNTLWEISDWLCVGVIMFAGASWMFGNRTKSMELMIGGSAGYLIIKHAKDIQEWLSSI